MVLNPAVETFDAILQLVYLPALGIVFFLGIYYLSPFLGALYVSEGTSNIEAVVYLLFALIWFLVMLLTLLL